MRIFIYLFLTVIIISCGSKTFKFKESDFEWIAYKGNETLIFTSNTGDTDTLYLKKPKRYVEYDVDPLSPFPQDSLEKFYITYYFSNDTTKRFGEYPGETIISMTKQKNKTRVGFGVMTNDAFFYGLRYFDMKELENTKLSNLQTKTKFYHDVLVIVPDTSNQKWASRDHYVLKMYWSKSEGLVRFDKNNKVYYTLTKKYGL